MKIKPSVGEKIFDCINILIMMVIVIIMLYPLWHVLCSSFSDNNILMKHSGVLLKPLGFNLKSYQAVFENPMVLQGYKNTLFVLVFGVLANMIMTSLAAYVLSQKGLYFNAFFMKLIIWTMYFNGGLIPGYLLVTKTLHLNDSLWALILPASINTIYLIILKASFASLPDSMSESAKLDGAGHWTILLKITLPLSKAILAVIALYYAVQNWNAWFGASIYLTTRSKYPLQLILREILIQNDVSAMTKGVADGDQLSLSETIKHAIIIVATVPILIVYPFLQKYFVKGTMTGAIKG